MSYFALVFTVALALVCLGCIYVMQDAILSPRGKPALGPSGGRREATDLQAGAGVAAAIVFTFALAAALNLVGV